MSDALRRLKQACARVEAPRRRGTAYLVAKDLALTCAHVVEHSSQPWDLCLHFLDRDAPVRATVLDRDSQVDWALLKLDSPLDRRPLALASAPGPLGAAWLTYGFPELAGTAGLPLDGKIADPAGLDRLNRPALVLTCPAAQGERIHGFSGAPLLIDGLVAGHLRYILYDDRPDAPPNPLVALMTVYATASNLFARRMPASVGAPVRPPPPPPATSAYDPRSFVQRPEERKILHNLTAQGAPAVLWAPEKFGKTWLMRRVEEQLCSGSPPPRVVLIDLLEFGAADRKSLAAFLQAASVRVAAKLRLDPKSLAASERASASLRLTQMMERTILPAEPTPLVLGIDHADTLLRHSWNDDFMGLLRSWANNATSPPWSQLRLLVATSTAPGLLTRDINKSPFVLSTPIELSDLTGEQIRQMAGFYDLTWSQEDLDCLRSLVGGHPYLVRLAMDQARLDGSAVARMVDGDDHQGKLFDPYLDHYRSRLRPELLAALRDVHQDPRAVLTQQSREKLVKGGLIERDRAGGYVLRYRLYERLLRV